MSERSPQKFAFVGTSCVGKTTLLDTYRDRSKVLSTLKVVDEAARDFFLTNAPADRFSAQTQGEIQTIVLKREQEAEASGVETILCDRSVVDAVVYTEAHGDPGGAKRLLDRVEFWLPTYSLFLLLDPADIAYEMDPVRVEDASKRQQFHEAFLGFFERTGIMYELLSGTIEQRVTRVDALLTR